MQQRLYLLIIWAFFSFAARAQTEQEILPAERKQLTIITEPYTLYKGFFRAGLSFQYSALYKIYDENGDKVPISNASGRVWGTQLLLQYGITDRLQLTAALPFDRQDLFLSYLGEAPGLNLFTQQKLEGQGRGLGDIWMGMAYQLVTETISRPSIKAMITATLPTGKKDPEALDDPELIDIPVGAGHFALDLAMAMRKISYPYSWTAYLSYKINMAGTKQFDLNGPVESFNNGNLLTVSGSFNFHMNEWLALTNDIYYFHSGEDIQNDQPVENSASWSVQYNPRLSFQIKRLRVNQAIQIPLFGKLSGADPGFILIVQYVF